eukprot:TRINITY_DN35863_c0_g1_i5.p1 TRINITY_DN35863_c0_g1~~TRINITY_DN35863_c0_g1_i5.p1  ORF type:complete len:135 (-),score=24.80 TRINITY_DN35863_c0_g1_i5:153-557(-)
MSCTSCYFFFFNDTATTEIYTRSIVGSVRCVQETVNAEYMGNTGESFFGPLSGGYILDCSQLLSRNLLEPDNRIVKTLGKKVNFELASGMNGRVHVKAKTVTDTILVVSLLQQSEHFSFSQMQKLFASTFKQSL